jgi:hypothetical protein
LLQAETDRYTHGLSVAIIRILDAYVSVKQDVFEALIADCEQLQNIQSDYPVQVRRFVHNLLRPNVDARVFEIVSYAILKPYYGAQLVYWGWSRNELTDEPLILYKTGRTNANDGGINFVMRPLGRFFQVTETTDVRKYFLDIDKIQRFPITFVVKSENSIEDLNSQMQQLVYKAFGVVAV